MKIQQLFGELEKLKETSKSDFEISGMVNRFNEMQFGFFPLGLGILTDNNKTNRAVPTTEIQEGGVMVLGNDFGTVSYVNTYVENPVKKIGETDSKTIRNLLKEKVGINKNNTFFTNFYLGVRTNAKATMTKRVEELTEDYKEICYNFFVAQLNLLNPSIIICLGRDVKNALLKSKESSSFVSWKHKSGSIKEIYDLGYHMLTINNQELGTRKFVIIPHPCDIRNFTEFHMLRIKQILNDNSSLA
jgi:uracil-DNA glycosylase family 4